MAKKKQDRYHKYTVSELERFMEQSSDAEEVSEILDALIFRRKQQLLQLTDQKSMAKLQKSERKGFLSRLLKRN